MGEEGVEIMHCEGLGKNTLMKKPLKSEGAEAV